MAVTASWLTAAARRYSQAEAMCAHYAYPILLIEFEATKAFALQSTGDLKDDISVNAISSKIVLLTLHFPKLKIIWSQSPHQTAEIFQELKVWGMWIGAVRLILSLTVAVSMMIVLVSVQRTFAEPDETVAASLGVDTQLVGATYNAVPHVCTMPCAEFVSLQTLILLGASVVLDPAVRRRCCSTCPASLAETCTK